MGEFAIGDFTDWRNLEKDLRTATENKIKIKTPEKRSFFSRFTKKPLANEKVYAFLNAKIKDTFNNQWGLEYSSKEELQMIRSITDQIMKECHVSFKNLNKVKEAAKIFNEIDIKLSNITINKDADLDIYESLKSENLTPPAKILKTLLGAPFDSSVVTKELVKCLTVSKNEQFMSDFRNAIQKAILDIYVQLQDPETDSEKEEFLKAQLGNLFSFYPFAEPGHGSMLCVPRKIDDKWKMVEYEVDVLSLSPKMLGSQIPALGLKPKNEPNSSPMLIFRGTPYPSAPGFFLSIFTDGTPFHSVGETIFNYCGGKKTVDKWINEASHKFGKVDLFGQSLGGAFSLLTVCNNPDKIGEAYLYGSPGLLQKQLDLYEKHSKDLGKKPKVNLFWNHGDMVGLAGKFHKDWNLNKVYIPNEQNKLSAHACVNGAVKKAAIMKIDPTIENNSTVRKVINIVHQIFSLIILPVMLTILAIKVMKVGITEGAAKISAAVKRAMHALSRRRRTFRTLKP